MSLGIGPVEHCHWTHVDANTVSSAEIPVDCDISSVYALLLRRAYRPPDIVTLMLTYDLAFLLEFRVYRQTSSPIFET
jgi:hypothetical protein